MWYNLKEISIWRPSDVTGFNDSVYSQVATISGTKIPISGSSAIRNNQAFSEVRDILICDLSYKDSIEEKDEVEVDNEWFNVMYIQKYTNVLPHLEIYLRNSQWRRNN